MEANTMRRKVCATLIALLAIWVVWSEFSNQIAQAVSAPPVGNGELVTFVSPLGDANQQLIVIDPRVRTVSVYHVQNATGEIALKSVRNFHWDLQLSHFNNTGLTPPEVRALLEQPGSFGR